MIREANGWHEGDGTARADPHVPVFLDGSNDRSFADRLSPRGHNFPLTGLTLMAMPPGEVQLNVRSTASMLNVIPHGPCELRTLSGNGLDLIPNSPSDRPWHDFHAPLDRFEIDCTNYQWEVLIELDHERLPFLMAEADGERWHFRSLHHGGADAALLQLGAIVLDHLRFGEPDWLYTESLAIAMTTRAMGLASERTRSVPTRGTDARIARAIDYVEANLAADLSITELAAVAIMSPSWFRECFHAVTGRPVHAYVLERRLQRARRLLSEGRYGPLRSRPSIQQVAHACGFADQSHLTRAFKRRYGVTPGALLRGS